MALVHNDTTVFVHGATLIGNLKWLKAGLCIAFVFHGDRNPQIFSTSLARWNWFCPLKED